MKKVKIHIVLLIISLFFLNACSKKEIKSESNTPADSVVTANIDHRIEFIELGSVNCIPCRQMQPIMSSIEKKYKGQVKVTFYDIWKDDTPAKKYGIDIIPTQVFLDSEGKELMRHTGFYAEEEIDRFLLSHGVNIPD